MSDPLSSAASGSERIKLERLSARTATRSLSNSSIPETGNVVCAGAGVKGYRFEASHGERGEVVKLGGGSCNVIEPTTRFVG